MHVPLERPNNSTLESGVALTLNEIRKKEEKKPKSVGESARQSEGGGKKEPTKRGLKSEERVAREKALSEKKKRAKKVDKK